MTWKEFRAYKKYPPYGSDEYWEYIEKEAAFIGIVLFIPFACLFIGLAGFAVCQ